MTALVEPGNPSPIAHLDHSNSFIAGLTAHLPTPVIAWSGTPAAGLFDRDPHAFAPAAWERFIKQCEAAPAHATIWFRPHARHVLSDVQRVVRFLADHPRFGVALDPARLLEESMLNKAADHYRRAFETLGPVARVIWLTSVAPPPSDDHPPDPAPLGQGIIPTDLIVRLWRECCPPETPVVFIGDDTERQADLFR